MLIGTESPECEFQQKESNYSVAVCAAFRSLKIWNDAAVSHELRRNVESALAYNAGKPHYVRNKV